MDLGFLRGLGPEILCKQTRRSTGGDTRSIVPVKTKEAFNRGEHDLCMTKAQQKISVFF